MDNHSINIGYLLEEINTPILSFLVVLSVLCWMKQIDKPQAAKLATIPCIIAALLSIFTVGSYCMEFFVAYYSGAKYEVEAYKIRITGPYSWAYALMLLSMMLPLLFWIPKIRKSMLAISIISILACSHGLIERVDILITAYIRGDYPFS